MKYLLLSLALCGCACRGAIGVKYDRYNDNRVSMVYPSSPAEKAGVQIGDRLLSPDKLQGEVGTNVVIELLRENEYLKLTTVRECGKIIKDRLNSEKQWGR